MPRSSVSHRGVAYESPPAPCCQQLFPPRGAHRVPRPAQLLWAAVPRPLVLFAPLRRLRPRGQDTRRPALAALEARCTTGCGLLCFLFFLSLCVIVLVQMDEDNDRQGQEEQEAQEPAPFGAPRFERRERRPPPVLSPRPESPQRGKKNKGPWHCCPEKLRRPRYRGKPAALRLLATVLLGTILCTLLAQHWRIDVGYVVEKCTTIASHHTAQLMIHIAV